VSGYKFFRIYLSYDRGKGIYFSLCRFNHVSTKGKKGMKNGEPKKLVGYKLSGHTLALLELIRVTMAKRQTVFGVEPHVSKTDVIRWLAAEEAARIDERNRKEEEEIERARVRREKADQEKARRARKKGGK